MKRVTVMIRAKVSVTEDSGAGKLHVRVWGRAVTGVPTVRSEKKVPYR